MMVAELSWLDEYRYAPAGSFDYGRHAPDTHRTADTADLRPARSFGSDLGALSDGSAATKQGWHDDALCAQTDPEAFFPEKGGSTREAKKICAGCPVRAECLESALANDERFGIWGGLSERERRRLRRSAA
jgi:WhiB family redox-sensing transcriptional regulator